MEGDYIQDIQLMKEATKDLLLAVVMSWLENFDSSFFNAHSLSAMRKRVDLYLDVVASILETYRMSASLLLAVVVYADKVVREQQGIHHNKIFYTLLASAICTVKYWDDSSMASHSTLNKKISLTYRTPLKLINDIEKDFLCKLQWNMSLRWEEVEMFFSNELCGQAIE